jgi:hypothetical protein
VRASFGLVLTRKVRGRTRSDFRFDDHVRRCEHEPTSQKRKISEGEGEARMEIFDRTFVTVGPSCGPELRNIRSCTGLQDCDLSESEHSCERSRGRRLYCVCICMARPATARLYSTYSTTFTYLFYFLSVVRLQLGHYRPNTYSIGDTLGSFYFLTQNASLSEHILL